MTCTKWILQILEIDHKNFIFLIYLNISVGEDGKKDRNIINIEVVWRAAKDGKVSGEKRKSRKVSGPVNFLTLGKISDFHKCVFVLYKSILVNITSTN